MNTPLGKLCRISGVALICLFVAAPGKCQPMGEDMSPGLQGVDANGNRIRDDIDALISQKYSDTPPVKKIAEDYALAVQAFMEAQTKKEAFEAAKASAHVIECINLVVLSSNKNPENYARSTQLIKEISSYTANTRERFEKYWDSNKMLNGATFSIDMNPQCE